MSKRYGSDSEANDETSTHSLTHSLTLTHAHSVTTTSHPTFFSGRHFWKHTPHELRDEGTRVSE